MKMTKVNFIEKFAIATFPIALAVGCTTTADQAHDNNVLNNNLAGQNYIVQHDNPHKDIGSENLAYPTTPYLSAIDTDQGDVMQNPIATVVVDAEEDLTDSGRIKVEFNQTDVEAINESAEILTQRIFHFELNKHDIAESDYALLQQHAIYLKEHADKILYVDGFSDNRGPANFNFQLSKKRAQQIANLLIQYGAPESRIKVNGYGESFPLNDVKNWHENRRVELEYSDIKPTDKRLADKN